MTHQKEIHTMVNGCTKAHLNIQKKHLLGDSQRDRTWSVSSRISTTKIHKACWHGLADNVGTTLEQQQNSRRPLQHHARDPHDPIEPFPNSGSDTTRSKIMFATNLESSTNCKLVATLQHGIMLHENSVVATRSGLGTLPHEKTQGGAKIASLRSKYVACFRTHATR